MSGELLLVAGAALAIMVAASVFSRRTGVAAPLLLVALGAAASSLPAAPDLVLDPELVIAGVLPPLLYASAVNVPVTDLRRNIELITWLSMLMVVVTAVVVGVLVHLVFPVVPLSLAIALGAVVSPTDAVAATAIGRRVGLPGRLMTVLEGESLVNDASALVVLRTAIAVAVSSAGLDVWTTALQFAWAVAGALAVGLTVGWLTVRLRARLDDAVLNATVSFAVPFLAFFPAEELEASGVLAVVVAGLVTGTLGAQRFSPEDRATQATTWSTISFVLEGAIFLAMGYQIRGLASAAGDEVSRGVVVSMVLLVVVLLLALRCAAMAWPAALAAIGPARRADRSRDRLRGVEERLDRRDPADERERRRLGWARRRLAQDRADVAFEEKEPLTVAGTVVLGWAGMRGAITVAAAQTIPEDLPYRSTVVLVASLVALVTLMIFGLTLPALIRRMHFASTFDEDRVALRELVSRVRARAVEDVGPLEAQVDRDHLDLVRESFPPTLLELAGQQRQRAARAPQDVRTVQRRYVDALRDALALERSIGAFGTTTYREVEVELDLVERRLLDRGGEHS